MVTLALAGAATPPDIATICMGENFTDVNTLQDWIEPIWYGNYTSFSKFVDLTPAQYMAFYDVSIKGSFGEALNTALSLLYTSYDCEMNTDVGTPARTELA